MRKNAFSLFEVLLMLVIIGVIFIVCVPIVSQTYKNKVSNAKYYEAYRTLFDATKIVKQTIPSHELVALRRDELKMGICDYYAQVLSLITDEEPEILSWCVDGSEPDPSSGGWGASSDGLCNSCTYVLEGESCPMDKKGQRHYYRDSSCSVSSPGGGESIDKYCKITPERVILRKNGCDDGSITVDAIEKFVDNGYKLTGHATNFVTTTPTTEYKNETDFDDPEIKGNFTTVNGLTFYGLEKYPQDNYCDGVSEMDWKKKSARVIKNNDPYDEDGNCNTYKTIYIDTNGKNKKRQTPCSACNVEKTLEPFVEATSCKESLSCLKTRFGVYKFRLYNDGQIVPLTDYAEVVGQLSYKLYFIKNDKIVEADQIFSSYVKARNYQISSGAKYKYIDENNKVVYSSDTSDYYIKEDDAFKKGVVCKDEPCKKAYCFQLNQCDIVPIIPSVKMTKMTKK